MAEYRTVKRISLEDAKQILLRFKKGYTGKEIAREFDVTEMTLWRIKTGRGKYNGLVPAKRMKKKKLTLADIDTRK